MLAVKITFFRHLFAHILYIERHLCTYETYCSFTISILEVKNALICLTKDEICVLVRNNKRGEYYNSKYGESSLGLLDMDKKELDSTNW